MFQVLYELTDSWPAEGICKVRAPGIEGEIAVSPDSARRRANGYLARYVALAMEAGEPVLHWGKRPVWRMPIYLALREWGQVAKLGEIAVDAMTRDVLQLSKEQIEEMQNRANAIAARLTPTATTAG
jgi:hypothetical protein